MHCRGPFSPSPFVHLGLELGLLGLGLDEALVRVGHLFLDDGPGNHGVLGFELLTQGVHLERQEVDKIRSRFEPGFEGLAGSGRIRCSPRRSHDRRPVGHDAGDDLPDWGLGTRRRDRLVGFSGRDLGSATSTAGSFWTRSRSAFVTTTACRPLKASRRSFSRLARSTTLWAPRDAARPRTAKNISAFFMILPLSSPSAACQIGSPSAACSGVTLAALTLAREERRAVKPVRPPPWPVRPAGGRSADDSVDFPPGFDLEERPDGVLEHFDRRVVLLNEDFSLVDAGCPRGPRLRPSRRAGPCLPSAGFQVERDRRS